MMARPRRPVTPITRRSGTVLPATGTRRLNAAGNACTRDAAAVSLLDVLLRTSSTPIEVKPADPDCGGVSTFVTCFRMRCSSGD
jgi:hypothetical protein